MITKKQFRLASVLSFFHGGMVWLFLLAVWLVPIAAKAAPEGIFLKKEGEAVAVPGFPGYGLERRGRDVFLAHGGTTRLIGTLGEIAAEFDGRHPEALAFDLDFDKIPEFLLLKKADRNDSLYILVHFKHGRNNGNYLFSDHLGFVFANPTFDAEKRIMTSRTSAGYSADFVYKAPLRKYYPHYQWTNYDYSPPTPSTTPPSATSAYFSALSDGPEGSVRLENDPILQKDTELSFMPGGLSLEKFPKASRVAITRATFDGRWVYLSGMHDHAPRGWVPASVFLATITKATRMKGDLETNADVQAQAQAQAAIACGPDLSAGTLTLVLDYRKDTDGSRQAFIRNDCGLTGWVDESVLAFGE